MLPFGSIQSSLQFVAFCPQLIQLRVQLGNQALRCRKDALRPLVDLPVEILDPLSDRVHIDLPVLSRLRFQPLLQRFTESADRLVAKVLFLDHADDTIPQRRFADAI